MDLKEARLAAEYWPVNEDVYIVRLDGNSYAAVVGEDIQGTDQIIERWPAPTEPIICHISNEKEPE